MPKWLPVAKPQPHLLSPFLLQVFSIITAVCIFLCIPLVILWAMKVWGKPKGVMVATFLLTILTITLSLLTFIFWIVFAETFCTGTLPTNYTSPTKGYSIGFILEVVACGLLIFVWILLLVSLVVTPKMPKLSMEPVADVPYAYSAPYGRYSYPF